MNTFSRRELLRDGTRALVLTGLLSAGALLGARRKTGGDSPCLIDLPCSKCTKFSGCSDPKVISYRGNLRAYDKPRDRHDS